MWGRGRRELVCTRCYGDRTYNAEELAQHERLCRQRHRMLVEEVLELDDGQEDEAFNPGRAQQTLGLA